MAKWYIALVGNPPTYGRGFPFEADTYQEALAHAEAEAARGFALAADRQPRTLVVDYVEPFDQAKADSLSAIQQANADMFTLASVESILDAPSRGAFGQVIGDA